MSMLLFTPPWLAVMVILFPRQRAADVTGTAVVCVCSLEWHTQLR
jgi:hypothetical protein